MWVADFTYVRTWAGFVYVAFVVDVFSQAIVGWHAATTQGDRAGRLTALQMAIWRRDHDGHPVATGELIHHTDAGSQYTSIRFTEHLALEGIDPSIGTVGDAYDNALMESMIGLYKTECIRTTAVPPRAATAWPTSSTPPPAGSTGTTPPAALRHRLTSRRPSTKRRTTLRSRVQPEQRPA